MIWIFGGFFFRIWEFLFGTEMGAIISFRLVNIETGESVIDPITNNTIIKMSTSMISLLTLEALGDGKRIGSVRFDHNNVVGANIENVAPYMLCESDGDILSPCNILLAGKHTIIVTPFSSEGAAGSQGASYRVSFTINNSIRAPIKQPVASPTIGVDPPVSSPVRSPLTPSKPLARSCRTPKLDIDGWSNYFPKYPIDITESQGFMIGNDIVNVGGFINGFALATNQTFARDITDFTAIGGVWRQMDDIPIVNGITHAAFVVVGKKLYICGGYLGGHPGPHSPYCFVYDHSKLPGTGQWSKFPNIPLNGTAGGGMVYDSTFNALYYATGGQRLTPGRADADDVSRTWKYSLTGNGGSWIATTPLPYAANHISFVTANDDKGLERHYFFGGQMSENETLANLEYNYEWDAPKERWIPRQSMPFGRGHAASSSVPVGCGFIVAGGAINGDVLTGKEATLDISYYNVPTNELTSLGNVTQYARTPIVQVGNDGYIYFLLRNSVSRRRGISF